MNFNMSLKALVVIILLSAGCGAGAVLYFQKPKIVEKTVTVTKTEQKFIRDPDKVDFNTTKLWAKSPIEIEYKITEQTRDYTSVSVHAFDLNKSTDQEIRVPVAECGNWKIYAGIGAGATLTAVVGERVLWKKIRETRPVKGGLLIYLFNCPVLGVQ
jgi:hypothetical protein